MCRLMGHLSNIFAAIIIKLVAYDRKLDYSDSFDSGRPEVWLEVKRM